MAEYYHEIEHGVGIQAYASSQKVHGGFAAVLKARYSDFIVHEVDMNGNKAVLTKLKYNEEEEEKEEEGKKASEVEVVVVKEEPPTKKTKLESTDETTSSSMDTTSCSNTTTTVVDGSSNPDSAQTDAKKVDIRHEELEQAHQELSKIVSPETSRLAIDMLLHWLDKTKQDLPKPKPKSATNSNDNNDTMKHYFIFPVIPEKEKRTQIHILIKGPLLQKYAVADTIDSKIRLWPQQFKTDVRDKFHTDKNSNNNNNNNKRKKGKKSPWPADRPPYLKFVLYKENLDTNSAIQDMKRHSRLPPNARINVAGMKDKRGITTQFCTVFKQTPSSLTKLNHWYHSKHNPSGLGGGDSGSSLMKVGNFQFVEEDLRLGMLTGNRFDITLRNVDITNPNSNNSNSDDGNDLDYTQQQLQQAAESFQKTGFINYFGMQRFGKSQDTHLVGIEILKGNFEKAIDIIMAVKPDEQERFTKTKQMWKSRFDSLSNDSNNNDNNNEDEMKKLEENCAKRMTFELGRFMMCEMSVMRSLSRKPRDYKTAFRCIMKNTQLIFLHAVQSYIWNKAVSRRVQMQQEEENLSVMIGDLVLTQNKSEEDGGSGTSGLLGKSVKVVTEQDILDGTFDITQVVLPLPGSKVKYPTHAIGEYFDELLKELGMNKDMWIQSNRELSLGGDYRPIICKPLDVSYEIKQYTDPIEPLIKTDLKTLQDMESNENKDDQKGSIVSSGQDETEDREGKNNVQDEYASTNEKTGNSSKAEENVSTESKKKILLGLVIGFTLPPSTYATIALRELMKRPTCSAYQSKLSLDGRCEQRIYNESK